MLASLFTNELYVFEQQLLQQVQNYQQKELRIIFALSDLLPEFSYTDKSNSHDYIQMSLQYLKEHYGLSKSAWLSLLMLDDKIAHFSEILSSFEGLNYRDRRDYYKPRRDRVSLNHICPIDSLPFIKNQRHYHIQKLFTLLSDLSANFGVEGACRYIGLFGLEFDTQESCFSIHRLNELSLLDYENLAPSMVTVFWNRFEADYRLTPVLRRLSWHYNDIYYPLYQNTDTKRDVSSFFNFIQVDTNEPLNFFFDLIHSYQKYTPYPFLSFEGLVDIQSKTIDDVDSDKIDLLLHYFNDYQRYHQVFRKVTIELVRLVSRYEQHFDRGLDKLTELIDYIYRSTEFKNKMMVEKNFSLTCLLQWSNQWHIKGESRGEFKPFFYHAIDLTLGEYYFEQIKNNYELHEEGQKQSHCVYSYEKDCFEGKAIIVSMQDRFGKRVATLRFEKVIQTGVFQNNSWVLAEYRKRFNRSCTSEERAVAQHYFEQIKNQLKDN